MGKSYNIVGLSPTGTKHSIAFISLLGDGSVSVGLRDKNLILNKVKNPHLTSHPYLNRISPNESIPPLFEDLVGLSIEDMILEKDKHIEFARLISKPVSRLKYTSESRDKKSQEIVIKLPSDTQSLKLGVDFIANDFNNSENHLFTYYIDCQKYKIYLFADMCPGQNASLEMLYSN